jgi:hypothetical protein
MTNVLTYAPILGSERQLPDTVRDTTRAFDRPGTVPDQLFSGHRSDPRRTGIPRVQGLTRESGRRDAWS